MGRGRSSSGGGSRGGSSWGGSSRGSSSWSSGSRMRTRVHSSGGRTTIIYSDGSHGNGSGGLIIVFIFGIIFCLVGAFAFCGGIGNIIKSLQYDSVYAVCVDNEYRGGWYYTTYSYEIDGNYYINQSNQGWELPEDKGVSVKIYYEKNNPAEISEDNPSPIGEGIMITIGGLLFIGFGTFPIILSIKEKKKLKNVEATTSQPSVINEPVKEDKNICPYCGTKYDKDLSSCPKCGASNNN